MVFLSFFPISKCFLFPRSVRCKAKTVIYVIKILKWCHKWTFLSSRSAGQKHKTRSIQKISRCRNVNRIFSRLCNLFELSFWDMLISVSEHEGVLIFWSLFFCLLWCYILTIYVSVLLSILNLLHKPSDKIIHTSRGLTWPCPPPRGDTASYWLCRLHSVQPSSLTRLGCAASAAHEKFIQA